MRVKIIYTMSGRGLHRDAELLAYVFKSLGHEVSSQSVQPASQRALWLERKWYRAVERMLPPALRDSTLTLQRQLRLLINGRSPFDLIIHLQSIQHRHLHKNCAQWLVPNQEWFSHSQLHYLKVFDAVVCKTREALHLFSRYHTNVQYTGFSSPLISHPPPVPEKNFQKALHVAGNSGFKGTAALVRVWRKHPEWPQLTLVCNQLPAHDELPNNIEVLSNISDDNLADLWATAGIAILPSEVEGFGQILVEAQAYGCVVVTTDAPPMNEVVDPSFGILVPYHSTGAFRMGVRYFVDPDGLEHAIQELWRHKDADLHRMSFDAAQNATENDKAFRRRIKYLISGLERSTSI
ncbi:glycosyltransferase [Marinobacter panjinensis]|uniref:glycosyltransferase n=1 Tax=Marinobacter panjinensis TaxID=2576384 RepID=UPI00148587D3|nr:glycosyltransferase [Marinobacter panjinensis]MCR8915834.1 glycosyltransferase [Marinobacter panjinensis]